MRRLLIALGMLMLPGFALAAPPVPVQAPTQAPHKVVAPAQAPTQAPAKAQANMGAVTPPQMASRGGYRSYSYQPSTMANSPMTYRGYMPYQRPRAAAGFQPAGYKATGGWSP